MYRPPIEAIKKNWRRSDTEDVLCDYALALEKEKVALETQCGGWANMYSQEKGEKTELVRLLCIAQDYLIQHWDSDSAPLDEIKQALKEEP